MLRRLKYVLLTCVLACGFGTVVLSVPAAAQSFQSDACNGLSQVGGDCTTKNNDTISNLFTVLIQLLSIIAGFAALVMVVISGIRFTTANGDSSKVAGARQALIYALVGAVVAAFAQYLVHFVIGKTAGGS